MLLRWSRYRNRDDSSLSILPSHSSYSRDSGLGVKTGASQAPAPGSIPGYGIFSQWPLWVKSRKVLHVKSCLCRLWSCDLVRLGKASSSSYIGIVSRIVILS